MISTNQWAVLNTAKYNEGIIDPYENMNTLCALMTRDLIAHDKKMKLRITRLGKAFIKNYKYMQEAPNWTTSKGYIYPLR